MLLKIRKLFFLLALLPASASAALIFKIDTFTTDQLTISIPAGSATLDATGAPPPDSDASFFYIIDPNGLNENWILGDTSGSGSGKINGIGFSEYASFDSSLVDHPNAGDNVAFLSSENLSVGDTVTHPISITWSGSNAFDPLAVSSLSLIWGEDGYPSSYPFGDPQGTTSTSVVPDISGPRHRLHGSSPWIGCCGSCLCKAEAGHNFDQFNKGTVTC